MIRYLLLASVVLSLGITMIARAQALPGTQTWESFIGGAFVSIALIIYEKYLRS